MPVAPAGMKVPRLLDYCTAAPMHHCNTALLKYHTTQAPTVLLLDGEVGGCVGGAGVSLHLPLHRFFAALLREVGPYAYTTVTIYYSL